MVTVKIDATEFVGEVEAMIGRTADWSLPLRQWAVHMARTSIKMNFDAQGRPEPWQRLKIETLIRRYLRTAGARKLREKAEAKRGGKLGQFEPRPEVFKDTLKGVGAISMFAGFVRSTKTGKVLRRGHRGYNKFAPQGKSFRTEVLRFIHGDAAKGIPGGKILQDNGTLMASMTEEDQAVSLISPFQVVVGTNLKYARAHQKGYAKKGIPARPFAVIQDEDVPILEDLLVRHLGGDL